MPALAWTSRESSSFVRLFFSVAFLFDLERLAKRLTIVFSMFVAFDANFSKVIGRTPSQIYNHFWMEVVHVYSVWLSGSVQ